MKIGTIFGLFDDLISLLLAIASGLFGILFGLIKMVAFVIGGLFAPDETGDIILAKRRRDQRKRIDALEQEIEKLKKS